MLELLNIYVKKHGHERRRAAQCPKIICEAHSRKCEHHARHGHKLTPPAWNPRRTIGFQTLEHMPQKVMKVLHVSEQVKLKLGLLANHQPLHSQNRGADIASANPLLASTASRASEVSILSLSPPFVTFPLSPDFRYFTRFLISDELHEAIRGKYAFCGPRSQWLVMWLYI